MAKDYMPMSTIQSLWDEFSDIPIDDEGRIQIEWNGFAVGTNREDVWYWFEEQNPYFSVGEMLKVKMIGG